MEFVTAVVNVMDETDLMVSDSLVVSSTIRVISKFAAEVISADFQLRSNIVDLFLG